MKKNLFGAVLIALAMALGLSGCATTSSEVDQIGLHYSGGPLEGRHFKGVVKQGSGQTFLGMMDTVAYLPINQRNYIVSKKADEGDRKGADIITVPAKGGVLMDFEISVYFKLNTHTDDIKGYEGGTLRKFYENICKKYHCTESKGWDSMLNDNLRKIIETSMRQKVFFYTVDELYANAQGEASGTEDAILKIQNEIASRLKENINSTLGGQYFCGPDFDRTKPDCPDMRFDINSSEPHDQGILQSFAQQRIAANSVITAEQEALAKKAAAEGTAAAAKALQINLTPDYLEYLRIDALRLCAQSAGCTIINGGGSQVIVDGSGKKGTKA